VLVKQRTLLKRSVLLCFQVAAIAQVSTNMRLLFPLLKDSAYNLAPATSPRLRPRTVAKESLALPTQLMTQDNNTYNRDLQKKHKKKKKNKARKSGKSINTM